MLNVNPFSALAETVSPLAMQGFIIAMISLIALGTIIQMINHKNLTYFLNNAKKQLHQYFLDKLKIYKNTYVDLYL